MDVKKIVLLVGALLIAARHRRHGEEHVHRALRRPEAQAAPVVPAGPEVLVATRTLPVGTIIDAEAFRYQPWPQGLVQPAYFIARRGRAATPQSLIGTVVRNEITAGQPLTQGALVRPGERGFLAAALGPGMRAVTVGVSATSGVAGFVFPGDRVDLVLTQEVTGGGDGPPLRASETIVRNIRVLADRPAHSTARDEAGNQVAQTFATVTFEATPKIAEKIAVAQTIGQLSLSLRSIADNNAELERAIAAGEVTGAGRRRSAAPSGRCCSPIASQPIDTNTTYTVGADVSRFQRAHRARREPGAAAAATPAASPSAGGASPPSAARWARSSASHAATTSRVVPVGAR